MSHHSTVFGQFLKLIPRHDFDALATTHHRGAPLRRMTRFSQFVAMATAHLAGRHSLRDVVANLAAQGPRLYHLGARPVARSSLARTNEEQPWTLYEALFGRLYARCQRVAPRHGFRFKNKLYSFDSSLIDLSLAVFPWAHYALGKAAMKLHLGLDHDGMLPAFAVVTESRVSDVAGARRLAFPKRSIVVFDKGYSDYAWLKSLDDGGVFYVTRARANIDAVTLDQNAVPVTGNVRFDRRVALAGKRPREMGMKPLRMVGYTCPDTGRSYVFLTNIEHLAAQTIADLYKARWQVELFFKWIKQNLKLKGFLGTSKNAVLTQIWAALCVSLLLAYLKFSSRIDLSMQQIARLLQLNLFLRRDLMALLRNQPPMPPSPPGQWALAL
ncbi:MAG: IS4 family transposase [Rhodospirillaceae bacterium]|nr:IS4 family transposase [Rhodospirillaceae bacterium]